MNKRLLLFVLFTLPLLVIQAGEKMKTTLSCQIYDFRGEMIYFDCVQSPFFRAEFHTNPGENHIYNFETDRLVTLLVNSRVQLVLEPGDSLHAVIRYGSNGRPERIELSGTERAVRQNNLKRDISQIQASMRYKTQLLACVAVDTKPADRLRDTRTFLEKTDKLIKLESSHCSPEFINYIRAEVEAIAYGSMVEYPAMYASVRHVPIEQQGIGDYWTIVDDYTPRDDQASLRCMPYSEFLCQYCVYQRTKEAHAAGKTYKRPQTLEEHYRELTSFFKGNQLDATLFLVLSNYIRNGKDIERVEPFLKEYKEKYNVDKSYAEILDSLMQ